MKTTKQHFELFKSECRKWEKRFGLDGWSILYQHEKLDDNSLAKTSINVDGRVVNIILNKDWQDEPLNLQAIKDAAKHETIHVLLGRLSGNAAYRFTSKIELLESEEELVYKLEKIIN